MFSENAGDTSYLRLFVPQKLAPSMGVLTMSAHWTRAGFGQLVVQHGGLVVLWSSSNSFSCGGLEVWCSGGRRKAASRRGGMAEKLHITRNLYVPKLHIIKTLYH